MSVAETAVAAAREQETLPGRSQVGDHRLLVLGEDLCSGGHLDRDVLAVGPGPVAAHAVDASASLEVLLVAVIDERVEIWYALDPDVAALASVAPVRSTELDELLAPEADAAITAVAGLDIDFRQIQKFHAAPRQRNAVIGRFLS